MIDDAVDKSKYNASLIRIAKSGVWRLLRSASPVAAKQDNQP